LIICIISGIPTGKAIWLIRSGSSGITPLPAQVDPRSAHARKRVEYVNLPRHVADLARYRARGYDEGQPDPAPHGPAAVVVDVHPPSVNSVDMAGVTVEYYPPYPAMGS